MHNRTIVISATIMINFVCGTPSKLCCFIISNIIPPNSQISIPVWPTLFVPQTNSMTNLMHDSSFSPAAWSKLNLLFSTFFEPLHTVRFQNSIVSCDKKIVVTHKLKYIVAHITCHSIVYTEFHSK